jgi:PPOX class probable F420-dependent enzyme
MSPDAVERFLTEPNPGVLTTLGASGWPHSAGMWFHLEDGALHMWTYAKSQKTMNARRDPRVALLVESGEPYRDLRGVLVRGRVSVTSDVDLVARVGARLYERYVLPRTGVELADGPHVEIERQAAKRVALILPLERVVSWDHSKA